MIVSANIKHPRKISTPGSTLDTGATILPFLGFTGVIGLGRNLMNSDTLKDRLFIPKKLPCWTTLMIRFWNFPRIKHLLLIDTNTKIVKIDNRQFKIPILIELTPELQTILKFGFYRSLGQKTLLQQSREISSKKYFILIERCKTISKIEKIAGTAGFCMIAGKGRLLTKITKLPEKISFSVNDLKHLLHISTSLSSH